jgi:hypothetical protein
LRAENRFALGSSLQIMIPKSPLSGSCSLAQA